MKLKRFPALKGLSPLRSYAKLLICLGKSPEARMSLTEICKRPRV
jgi:hypothetical protein